MPSKALWTQLLDHFREGRLLLLLHFETLFITSSGKRQLALLATNNNANGDGDGVRLQAGAPGTCLSTEAKNKTANGL
jgi:hypothetical protein